MPVLITNISENILDQNIINESFSKLNKYNLNDLDESKNKISEIFYINEKISKPKWNFENIKLNSIKIDMNKEMEELYSNINHIIENVLDKKEFIDVIVDTSFLAYIILEILIKNFNIADVFILEDNKLKKAHPCGCGPEYIGY